MSLVSQRIPDCFGGVSTQAQEQRKSSQVEEQVNMLSRFGRYLCRRPATTHVAQFANTITDPEAIGLYPFIVDGTARYWVIAGEGELSVYDADTGAEQTVLFPRGKGYLSSDEGFRFCNAEDTVVLLNKSRVTAKGTTTAPARVHEALLWVRQGEYSTRYSVTVDSNTVSLDTVDEGAPAAAAGIRTTAIASDLETLLAADSDYVIWSYGNVLHIRRDDGGAFSISCSDGLAGNGLTAIKDSVANVTDLPPQGKPGFVTKVVGQANTTVDDYWVEFVSSPLAQTAAVGYVIASASGYWRECPEPGGIVAFDDTTLPHRLVKNGTLVTGPVSAPADPSTYAGSAAFSVIFPDTIYPAGVNILLTLESVHFADVLAIETGTLAVDTHASTVVSTLLAAAQADTYFTGEADYDTFGLLLRRRDNSETENGFALIVFSTQHAWFPDAAMVPDEHIGRTIRNLTDGCSAVITANTATVVSVALLTGGTNNTFSAGDVCEISGGDSDYFVFEPSPWSNREAGDLTSVPFPSFIGRSLTDMFVHQGRLGFITGNGIVLSRSADYFNLFRRSATDLLADDPIDARTTLTQATFHTALEWDERLMLWTNVGQFFLEGEPVLTPTTIEFKQASAYANDPRVRPLVVGTRAFFVARQNDTLRLMEYFVPAQQSDRGEAKDVSEHAAGYLLGAPVLLAADPTTNLVFLLSRREGENALVYTYSFALDGDERKQQALSRWDFGAFQNVLALDVADGILWLISKHPDGIYLSKSVLDPVERVNTTGSVFDGSTLFDGSVLFI